MADEVPPNPGAVGDRYMAEKKPAPGAEVPANHGNGHVGDNYSCPAGSTQAERGFLEKAGNLALILMWRGLGSSLPIHWGKAISQSRNVWQLKDTAPRFKPRKARVRQGFRGNRYSADAVLISPYLI